MAGTITHKWNGTVLTVTSDSGTSSMDLKGSQGDMGVRGPQGAPGVLVDTSGTILAPANNYYLKEEVDDAIAASKKDVSKDITTLQESVESDILELQNTYSAHSKRITNLEHTLAPTFFETDDSIAYMKDVPETALSYAEVNEIGGMSYKTENLIPFPYNTSTGTISNVAFTVNNNGSVVANGTASSEYNAAFYLCDNLTLSAGNYTLSGSPSGLGDKGTTTLYYENGSGEYIYVNAYGGEEKTFTLTTSAKCAIYLQIFKGQTVSNLTFYPMLNRGSTALSHKPYFTGLRDSKVTAVESVGTNLLNMNALDNKTTNGITFTKNSDGTYTANGTATAHVQVWLATIAVNNNESLWLSGGGDGVQITVNGMNNGNFVQNIGTVNGNTMKLVQGVTYNKIEVYLVIINGKTLSNYTFYGMLNKGTTALPFAPYVKHTFPIPEAVQALEGYGQGINKDYYNKVVIDPDNFIKKYVQKAQTVVLDGVTNKVWYVGNTNNMYYASFTPSIPAASGTNLVSSHFTKKWSDEIGNIYIDNWGNFTMFNTDQSLTSVAKWNEWLQNNNVTICYELATPTETDISDIVPDDDNFIRVYGGGTVTAVNEYKYDVPTKITYQFKEATI